MTIILYTLASYLLCFYFGYGVTRLCLPQLGSRAVLFFSAPIGFILSSILFYHLYFAMGGVSGATYLLLGLSTVFNILAQAIHRSVPQFSKHDLVITVGAILLMTVYLSATHMHFGWDNYFHTGNEDMYDATNGVRAYTTGNIYSGDLDEFTGTNYSEYENAAYETTGALTKKGTSFFYDRYGIHETRLQYSVPAMWAFILKSTYSASPLLLVMTFCNIFFALGLFYLSRYTFALPFKTSIAVGLIPSLSHFYTGTFMNGHEGSTLFMAVAPTIFLLWHYLSNNKNKTVPVILLLLASLYYIAFSYPYPLAFFLPAAPIYFIDNRWGINNIYQRLKLYIQSNAVTKTYLGIAIVLFIGVVVTITIAELPYFLKVVDAMTVKARFSYRSWGSIFYDIGWYQYWGLFPSQLSYGTTLLYPMSINIWVISLCCVCATALSGLCAYYIYRSSRNNISYAIFILTWISGLIIFRLLIRDSYYLYKFLYVTQFALLIPMIVGVCGDWKSYRKSIKRCLSILFCLTFASNTVHHGLALADTATRDYNRNAYLYFDVLNAPEEYLNALSIQIPHSDYQNMMATTLLSRGYMPDKSKFNAPYYLKHVDSNDIFVEPDTDIVWANEKLYIAERPSHDIIDLRAYWEPEHDVRGHVDLIEDFRWVSNGYISLFFIGAHEYGENDLRFCAKTGPGIDYQPITFDINDSTNEFPGGSHTIENKSCFWISNDYLKKAKMPILVSTEQKGHQISKVDTRRLNAMVFNIQLTPTGDIDDIHHIMYSSDDIYSLSSFQDAGIQPYFGSGWHGQERLKGKSFRWISGDASFQIHTSEDITGSIEFELAPGPNFNGAGIPLTVSIEGLDTQQVIQVQSDSTKVTIPLELKKGTSTLHLKTPVSKKSYVRRDHRQLNLKVTEVNWIKDQT